MMIREYDDVDLLALWCSTIDTSVLQAGILPKLLSHLLTIIIIIRMTMMTNMMTVMATMMMVMVLN